MSSRPADAAVRLVVLLTDVVAVVWMAVSGLLLARRPAETAGNGR